MIRKIILPAASPYLNVHPQTPAARKAAGKIFRHLMGAAGRKWNSMNSTERYELLIEEIVPDRSRGVEAVSKYSIQRWQQLPRGTRVLVMALLARKAKAATRVVTSRADAARAREKRKHSGGAKA